MGRRVVCGLGSGLGCGISQGEWDVIGVSWWFVFAGGGALRGRFFGRAEARLLAEARATGVIHE